MYGCPMPTAAALVQVQATTNAPEIFSTTEINTTATVFHMRLVRPRDEDGKRGYIPINHGGVNHGQSVRRAAVQVQGWVVELDQVLQQLASSSRHTIRWQIGVSLQDIKLDKVS